MKLEDIGYNNKFEKYRGENNLLQFEIGRVILEHKERYTVLTENGEFEAEITGNLRFSAKSREDFPAVGDWVALQIFEGGFAIIHNILPRYSLISRQAVGHFGEIQIIATNIDYAFLVQAVDRDFNINRLERYLTICNTSKVIPIIVLTKTDQMDGEQNAEIIKNINQRISNIQVIAISNISKNGYNLLEKLIKKGFTYCLLGSSGVGKSTLVNNLSEKELMKTDAISQSSNKGRHITSHRELTILKNGGILIDNPGMREVGIADNTSGLEQTFDRIIEFSRQCKYNDCTHIHEEGCAVLEAVDDSRIDRSSYENYLRMGKEKARFEASVAERRQKEKEFGKLVKHYKNTKNRNRSN